MSSPFPTTASTSKGVHWMCLTTFFKLLIFSLIWMMDHTQACAPGAFAYAVLDAGGRPELVQVLRVQMIDPVRGDHTFVVAWQGRQDLCRDPKSVNPTAFTCDTISCTQRCYRKFSELGQDCRRGPVFSGRKLSK